MAGKKEKITLRIGGREFPLMLSTYEAIAIQEEIGCTIAQMRDDVFGVEHNLETDEYTFNIVRDKDKMQKLGKLIRICGNAGLEEDGQEPDLTDKWILRNLKPGMIVAYSAVMMAVVNDAMRTEISEKQAEESGPVDEVLAEENRKKEPGN